MSIKRQLISLKTILKLKQYVLLMHAAFMEKGSTPMLPLNCILFTNNVKLKVSILPSFSDCLWICIVPVNKKGVESGELVVILLCRSLNFY